MSVFIGVPITAKQASKWVIMCCVASLWRDMAQIKKELVSIQTCKKEDEESSGLWVTSICYSSLGCELRGLIPCVMGQRCRGLQVEPLLLYIYIYIFFFFSGGMEFFIAGVESQHCCVTEHAVFLE